MEIRYVHRYALGLALLTGLFALRVVAQPLALVLDFLPAFETWHSGALPYAGLVVCQLMILTGMTGIAWLLYRGRLRPNRRLGRLLILLGSLYMVSMLVRLGMGSSLYAGDPWFDRPLPTLFHFVLAGYLLVLGRFHVDVR